MAAIASAGRAEPRPSPQAGPSRPATVLVVDDSAVTRTLEKGILEAAGYQVRVAADGAAALELLGREPCDLVVTEVEMPRLDGFSLTARVRAVDRLRDLPAPAPRPSWWPWAPPPAGRPPWPPRCVPSRPPPRCRSWSSSTSPPASTPP